MPTFISTPSMVSVFLDGGRRYMFPASHPNFMAAAKAARASDWELIPQLTDSFPFLVSVSVQDYSGCTRTGTIPIRARTELEAQEDVECLGVTLFDEIEWTSAVEEFDLDMSELKVIGATLEK